MQTISLKNFEIAIFLFLLTLIIYFLSYTGEGKHWNYFVLLADAFLHGRLYLLENPSWLNELINWEGKYYVVYPIMPAILLLPLVFLFGISFSQPHLSILIGAMNVGLSFLFFSKIFKQDISVWLSLLYAFGTMHWYHTEVGSAWYIAHIIANLFIWIALLEIFGKKRLVLIGILIGGAYLSRLPAILTATFVIIYLYEKFLNIAPFRLHFKNFLLFSIGLFVGLFINWTYNYLRFGTIEDITYRLLPVFEEPWYKDGLFDIKNIPIHLTEVFTALPKFINEPPYIIPSLNVMALWFVTPALLLIPFANFKNKLVIASLITIIIMSLPGLMHGSNGFSQFGFRFALDYMPFLLILVGSGLERYFTWWSKSLIILSILINLWGVIMLSHLMKFIL